MTRLYETEICIGDFEDIPAVFDLDIWKTDIKATLKFAQLAHITLTPEMIGREEVARLERYVEETTHARDHIHQD